MHLFVANAKARLKSEPIMRVFDLVDWRPIETMMQSEFWRECFRRGGRMPYDHRAMFRALLLAEWYGLSYPKLERALRLRLDFLFFCGFEIDGNLPDASTLNRFKTRLEAAGVFDKMVVAVEQQLQQHGLALRLPSMALGDAELCLRKAR